MIISDKKKFIFVHIYKTAGTSIEKNLNKYARKRERFIRMPGVRNMIKVMNQLIGKPGLLNRIITGNQRHARAIEISEVIGVEKFNNFYKFAFVRDPYAWVYSLYSYMYKSKMSFPEFVDYIVNNEYRTQSSFIYDGKCLAVDYVGKVEEIDKDFEHICNHLHIKKGKLQKMNTSSRGCYKEQYTKNIRECVYLYFQEDFDNFGYEKDF